MIFGLAWRNLWRDWRRSVVAIAALALGLAALLLLLVWTSVAGGAVRWLLLTVFAVCAAVVGLVAVMIAAALVTAIIGERMAEIAMLRAIGFSLMRTVMLIVAEIAMLALGACAAALACVWTWLALWRDASFASTFLLGDTRAQALIALALALIVMSAWMPAWRQLRRAMRTEGGALADALTS